MDEFFSSSRKLYKSIITDLRDFKLTTNHREFPHYCIVPFASYSPWKNDDAFLKAYESIKSYTLVDIYRCYEIWKQVGQLSCIAGDILEVGVWRGGTSALMCLALEHFGIDKKIYAADTFEGVVKAGENDTLYKGGEHSDCSESATVQYLSGFGDRIEVLKGTFPEAFQDHPSVNGDLALTHIDVDTYESARETFQSVWPRTSIGGLAIFDDYGFWGCEGVTKLVNSLDLVNTKSIHNLNGHAMMIKIK